MNVNQAITDLRLEANPGKLARMDETADEYMFVTQAFVRHLIGVAVHPAGHGLPPLGRFEFHPQQKTLPPIATALSERWKRCAWMQACGVVDSWLSNGRHLDGSNEPSLDDISIQGNANVVVLSKSKASGFDWWLRVSTLDKGKPVLVPFTMHPYGASLIRQALSSGGRLSGGVTLRKRDGVWLCQLCVTRKVTMRKTRGRRGYDVGLAKVAADSRGRSYGTLSKPLKRRIEADAEKTLRKQKLNACLRKKTLPEVSLVNGATERWVRNEVGLHLNRLIDELLAEPRPPVVILEKLSVRDMRFKSREQNRLLKAGQIGHITRRFRYSLDLAGIAWREVNAAYSSQECPHCGFVLRQNRPSQDRFVCLMCGYTDNADTKAALVIEGRSHDDELNKAGFRETGTILAERFIRRWAGACPLPATNRSASGPPVGDWRPGIILPGRKGSPTGMPEHPLGRLKPAT
jgi:putative transposase